MPAKLMPLVAALAVATGACNAAVTNPGTASTGQHGPASSSPAQRPEPIRSTLRVDWNEQGDTWRPVLRVRYGPADGQLGIDRFPDQAPIVPSSFAVTSEGFTIADPAKNRVVLLGPTGSLVRQWDGLPQVLSDLAADPAHDRLVVITHEYEQEVTELHADGTSRSRKLDRIPIALSSAPDGIGIVLRDESGTETDATLDEHLAVVDAPTGFPAGDGDHVVESSLSQDGDRHRVTSTAGWTHEFQFRATSRPRLAVTTFDSDFHASAGNLYFAMRIGSFQRYPGETQPLHLLILDAHSGAIDSFERVAMCSLRDTTNQYGYVAVKGAEVYQLCLTESGAEIRQRP